MNASKHTSIAKAPPTPRFLTGANTETAVVNKQDRLEFYAGPPEPGDRFFMGFTVDHDENAAAAVFAHRHGRPPEFVFESHGNLLCGPIPEVAP